MMSTNKPTSKRIIAAYTLGWIGSWLLALCGLPQALQSLQQGHSDGVSIPFLWMWLVGEIFTVAYLFLITPLIVLKRDYTPLVINYSINIGLIIIILYFAY